MSVTQKTDLFAEKEAQSTLQEKSKESFIQGLKNELRKVSWTPKKELTTLTKTVLLSTVVFGLGIYAVDLVIKQCLFGIHALARLVFGA